MPDGESGVSIITCPANERGSVASKSRLLSGSFANSAF